MSRTYHREHQPISVHVTELEKAAARGYIKERGHISMPHLSSLCVITNMGSKKQPEGHKSLLLYSRWTGGSASIGLVLLGGRYDDMNP